MIKIRIFSSLILTAIILAACAAESEPVSVQPTATEAGPDAVSTEAPPPSPLPIATSRGPELHATDPTSVNLASGGLQLVEFFRFT